MKRAALAGLLVLAMAGGCESAADKAGGQVVVLKMASIDQVNGNGQAYGPQAFVDSLAKVSGGRLKVEVKNDYGGGAADAETDLVKAIKSGELDGGWPATRAFAAAGIDGLKAVEAPMTITSYDAEKALATGPGAKTVLAQLNGSGVVGLGLAVGPLRRPFAAVGPLLAPSDWKGVKFRTYNSPVQNDTMAALGASPVNIGFGWVDEIRNGKLRGVELDIAQYAHNGESTVAGNVTGNVVLWPKMFVLSVSQRRFDALTDQQRKWVRDAAAQAVTASATATYDETSAAKQLCGAGTRFVDATPDQVASLRTTVKPVIDKLAGDAKNGKVLREIQAVAAAHPATESPNVELPCRQATSVVTSTGDVPSTVAALPDGVYRVEHTLAEVQAAGLDNHSGETGTWTMTIRKGTFEMRCRPLDNPGVDCGGTVADKPLGVGDLRGSGDLVYFVPDVQRLSKANGCQLPVSETDPRHCPPDGPFALNWSVGAGGAISFKAVTRLEAYEMVIEPWQKIG